jgi:hypothetical protein
MKFHVDADVAREDEINCAKPCPPAQDTCEALAQRVMTWLGNPVTDERLVLCIPADNTEAWVLAAHDIQTAYHAPPDKPLECVQKPDMIISNQGYKKPRRLLRRKDGKPKKTKDLEQNNFPVCQACSRRNLKVSKDFSDQRNDSQSVGYFVPVPKRDYQQLIPVVLDNWEEVKRLCPQAAKFENDLKGD